MDKIKNKVPPLAWLRAFEAAGRLGSFKAAADDLNVSPSTISHQVRDLEALLGILLFSREAHSMALTEEGRIYLGPLSEAFALIHSTFSDGRPGADELRVGVFPFLTNEVLLPKIDALKKHLAVSKLSLRSETDLKMLVHPVPEQRLDVVVRYSQSNKIPGFLTLKLFDIELAPVQAAHKPVIDDLETLLSEPVVSVLSPFDAWQVWREKHQVVNTNTNVTMETDSYFTAVHAVARGEGICLGIIPFLNPWLVEGKIQAIERFRCKIDYAAYLVYAPHNQNNSAIKRLQQWLIDALR